MRFEEHVAARGLYRNISTFGDALSVYVEAYVKANYVPGSSGILHGCPRLCSYVVDDRAHLRPSSQVHRLQNVCDAVLVSRDILADEHG